MMDRALEMAPACVNYKTKRAECLALLGRYNEAQEAAKYDLSLIYLYILGRRLYTAHAKCKCNVIFSLGWT